MKFRYSSVALSSFLALALAGHADVITSTFTDSNGGTWSRTDASVWDSDQVPINNTTDQYHVILPASLGGPVILAWPATVNTLTVGNGTTFEQEDTRNLTIREGLTNNGTLHPNLRAQIYFDHLTDTPITLDGSGTLRLTGGAQGLRGGTGQQLVHGSNHTIEGYTDSQSLGFGQLDIENLGTITANVSDEGLRLRPVNLFENSGTVSATNGGAILFAGNGTYAGPGTYRIEDDSRFEAENGSRFTFKDLVLSTGDTDGDPSNNVFHNAGWTTLDNVTFGPGLTVTNGGDDPFIVLNDLTNHATIDLAGDTVAAGFVHSGFDFQHPTGDPITLGGTGTVLFRPDNLTIAGPADQVIVNGPGHTLKGSTSDSGPVRSNGLKIRNEGMIDANVPGEPFNFKIIGAGNEFENAGTILIREGASMTFGRIWRFDQTDGELRVDGTFNGPTHPLFRGGKVTGSGRLIVDDDELMTLGGTIAPGSPNNPIGSLDFSINGFPVGQKITISGVPTNPTRFEIDLASQTETDLIRFNSSNPVVTTNLGHHLGSAASGHIELALSLKGPASGFTGERINFVTGSFTWIFRPTTIQALDEVSGGLTLTNVAVGERLTTTDGRASFLVQGLDLDNDPPIAGQNANGPLSAVWLEAPLFAPEWDAPSYAFFADAGASIGTAIGTVSATDPESGSVTYSIASGAFAINPSTGVITVADPSALGDASARSIEVTATDGELMNTITIPITLNVTNGVSQFSVDPVSQMMTISWDSEPGAVYDVRKSTNLHVWDEAITDIPSQGTQTSAQVSAQEVRAFLRVIQQ